MDAINKKQTEDEKRSEVAENRIEELKAHLTELEKQNRRSSMSSPGGEAISLKQYRTLADLLQEEEIEATPRVHTEGDNASKPAPVPPISLPSLPQESKELPVGAPPASARSNSSSEFAALLHSEKFAALRDAGFEFFALTTLAIKINTGNLLDSLYTVSTKDLWDKSQREGVQFHQYHSWIQREITKAYVKKVYEQRSSAAGKAQSNEPSSFKKWWQSSGLAASLTQLGRPIWASQDESSGSKE